jgi:hypothetical protein
MLFTSQGARVLPAFRGSRDVFASLLFMSVISWLNRFCDVTMWYSLHVWSSARFSADGCIVRLRYTGYHVEWKCHHVGMYQITLMLVSCYLVFRDMEAAKGRYTFMHI